MDIISTLILTANMITAQFCSDFKIDECKIKIEPKEERELPWVGDPKGTRRAHGYCVSNHKIVLNIQHWSGINDWEKKELIYHELGHCFLGLGHNSDISIMNPFPKTTYYHVKKDGSNWHNLVIELKNRVNNRKKYEYFQ